VTVTWIVISSGMQGASVRRMVLDELGADASQLTEFCIDQPKKPHIEQNSSLFRSDVPQLTSHHEGYNQLPTSEIPYFGVS